MLKELIFRQIENLLRGVPSPRSFNYKPHSEGRSSYGFVGIRNLGATCYMNSLLQQFFLTKVFRYCLLSADDRVAPLSTPPVISTSS